MTESRNPASRDEAIAEYFARLEAGDAAAVDGLYRVVSMDLFGYLAAVLGSVSDAEDAMQEVFLDMVANYRRFGHARRPWCYIMAAARNRARRMMKKRSAFQPLDGVLLVEPPRAEANARAMEEAGNISAALKSLPLEQREVVVMKLWEGLTFKEIARVTGTSQDTAASRYRYGIEKLRLQLAGRRA